MIARMGKATAAATILGGIPLAAGAADDTEKANAARLKVLVIGAHPDDPETCAGGTMCLLANAGHKVTCAYLTRGEAGIEGMSHDEAAAVRVEECKAACAVTGATFVFLNQIDGSTEVSVPRYHEMIDFIREQAPDIVLTHWPIDAHRDHAACGMLVLDAWRRLNYSFDLYYFEAMSGTQSQLFHPTHWVSIDSVLEQKHRACFCHKSQHMDDIYNGWHTTMEQFRGIECRCKAAEAFIKHTTALATLD